MEFEIFPLALVLLACGVIGIQETGTPLGLVFPTASTIGVVTAAIPSYALVFAWAALVCGAVVGDCVAVTWGRRTPERAANMVRRHSPRLAAGIDRYGVTVLLFTRFVPVLRTIAPAGLGSLRGPSLRTVIPFSAAGACVWSAALLAGGKVVTEVLSTTGLDRAEVLACTLGFAAAGLFVVAVAHTRRHRVRHGRP